MINIAYYYTGKKDNLDKLLHLEPTILIDNELYARELTKYNYNIKIIKYDNVCYDIVVGDVDIAKNINAIKKVVINGEDKYTNRTQYLKKFDIDKILEAPQKKDYKFSIIVPNYNNGDWINKTIESVINQTYDTWEMYIIDDMSNDNSIEVIKQYKDKRITLIQNEIKLYNGGSRNVGILKAKKSNPDGYLLFIDSDDWLANNDVLKTINSFSQDEDLITLDYQYYMNNQIREAGKCHYSNKDDLFMTNGCMCAVWCKCFKTSVSPLFEFNTLMEDRNFHYRLINRITSYANLGKVTHTWNKMNSKSITTDKKQKYKGNLQAPIIWNNCAYRHIAGMLDLLDELENPRYRSFIEDRIQACINNARCGIFLQY